jgi:hypothetical protein
MEHSANRFKWSWLLALIFAVVQIVSSQVPAAIYTYTTIDVPGADPSSTTPMAINNLGQIVGTYTVNKSDYGFSYNFGTFTNLGANVYPSGINDSGDIAGYIYGSNGQQGIPSITLPNCEGCFVIDVVGIDNLGETVGTYFLPSGGTAQSFALLSDGLESVCPSTNPIIYAIGNSSLIVGETNTGAGAFIQDGVTGSCTTYAFPGLALPTDTTFFGVNLWGEVVGGSGGNGGGGWSAPPGPFVFESQLGGNWAEIQLVPPPTSPTCNAGPCLNVHSVNGVNDFGQIVGMTQSGYGFVTSGGSNVVIVSAPLSKTSVAPGGSATATIMVGSVNNFTGAVTLSCSVSPMSTEAPTCSFNPNPVTPPAGSSASSTLTVNTLGAEGSLWLPNQDGRSPRRTPWFLLSTLIVGTMCIAAQRKKRQLLLCSSYAFLVVILLPCVSCGSESDGNSGNGGGTGGGTAAGTYIITVSAAGQTSQTTSLTLTVQ